MIIRADCFEYMRDNVADNSVDLIVTDPPYGRIVTEGWDKNWRLPDQWRMTEEIARVLKPGGTAYVWGGIGKPGDRVFFNWLAFLEGSNYAPGMVIWDLITWRKRRFYGTKTRYGFAREECAMLVKGEKPATFNIPLLETKRGYAGYNKDYPAKSEFLRRTNVWDDVNELFKGKIHPTEKPSRLAEIMIETSSNPGETVLDMFAGSGSTGVAARKLGRECILIEMGNGPMHDSNPNT